MADLAVFGVEAAYLAPTRTGLGHRLMDAHHGLRRFLLDAGIHDFDRQAQGTRKKVVGKLLTIDGWLRSTVSLYKPQSKAGDPRIWFYGLDKNVAPHNLMVVLAADGELFFINASNEILWQTLAYPGSPLNDLVLRIATSFDTVETELLNLIQGIASKGFIASTTNASSGVGDTLEALLGLKRNSNKTADYKGIELKASRLSAKSGRQHNRNGLFSEKPDWTRSEFKGGRDFVDKFGYLSEQTGLKALQVTVNHTPNAQRLFLAVSEKDAVVEARHASNPRDKAHAVWDLSALESRLAEKHRATFWVKAKSSRLGAAEFFQYVQIQMTSTPLILNFGPLVASGMIQLDYTFSEKHRPSGKLFVRDHGYLWKIKPAHLELLFPPPRVVELRVPGPP